MPDLELTMSGGDDLLESIERLDKADKREFLNAAKKGTRELSKPMWHTARALAPKVSGRLRKAIKRKVRYRRQWGTIEATIAVDPGRSRADTSGAWYGDMVNSGYIANGQYVPGRHFIEGAYDMHAEQAGESLLGMIDAAADAVL